MPNGIVELGKILEITPDMLRLLTGLGKTTCQRLLSDPDAHFRRETAECVRDSFNKLPGMPFPLSTKMLFDLDNLVDNGRMPHTGVPLATPKRCFHEALCPYCNLMSRVYEGCFVGCEHPALQLT